MENQLKNYLVQLLDKISDSPIVMYDYFHWGKDLRLKIDQSYKKKFLNLIKYNSISMRMKKKEFIKYSKKRRNELIKHEILEKFDKKFSEFEKSFKLFSDEGSRILFAELILMKLISSKFYTHSKWTEKYIQSYEICLKEYSKEKKFFNIYGRKLKKTFFQKYNFNAYTLPTIANLIVNNRCYEYANKEISIKIEKGDNVIDAGMGWSDTTIFFAKLANEDKTDENNQGNIFCFDICNEALEALKKQKELNPDLKNVFFNKLALSDKDDKEVNFTAEGPGAMLKEKGENTVKTVSIDSFFEKQKSQLVNFIKMDIEGSEINALKGGKITINKYKPKLAISAYHKWDDLLKIPLLIHSIRPDYKFYLDCSTGFGGEAVIFCH